MARPPKRIRIGKPTVQNNVLTGGNNNVSVGSSSTLSVAAAEGATEYYWNIYTVSTNCGATTNSAGLTIYPTGTVIPKFYPSNSQTLTSTSRNATIKWGNCSGSYVINCYAKNECGLTAIGFKSVNVYNAGGGGSNPDPCEPVLNVYPNPVEDGEINIIMIPPPGDPCDLQPGVGKYSKDSESLVSIYDMFGNSVYSAKMHGETLKIEGLKLRTGHYILNIFSNLERTVAKF